MNNLEIKDRRMDRHEETYRGFTLVVGTWKGILQGRAWEGHKLCFNAKGASKTEVLESLKLQIGKLSAQPTVKEKKYAATSNSIGRVFHHHWCKWMNRVSYSDEIKFTSREDALAKLYSSCNDCRP